MADSREIPILWVEVADLTPATDDERRRRVLRALQETVTASARFFMPHADAWAEWKRLGSSDERYFLFEAHSPAVALEYARRIAVALDEQRDPDLTFRLHMALAVGNQGHGSPDLGRATLTIRQGLPRESAARPSSTWALAVTAPFHRALDRDPGVENFSELENLDWRTWIAPAGERYYLLGQGLEDLAEPEIPSSETPKPLTLQRIELRHFKNIESLTIDFEDRSHLDGNWTCIAGINGSGKTSILQAIALLMLGRRRAAELGGNLLKRLQRRPRNGNNTALRAVVRDGDEAIDLLLPIGDQGIDEERLSENGHARRAEELWQHVDSHLVVAYGATRNLSSYRDTRYENLSSETLRLMTLFEPSSQIAEAAVILEGSSSYAPIETLRALLEIVLEDNDLGLSVGFDPAPRSDQQHQLVFWADRAPLDADELPDGFRVLVAWLADVCISWHKIGEQQKQKRTTYPEDITGIVLLDEIDLHLHPSLQRTLVPRLRQAMPKVQWIVTTHSPLILASFDSSELIVLDRNAEGGIRRLDRQILGFSTDQVYRWLMGTEPYSAAIEDKLERGDADVALLLHCRGGATLAGRGLPRSPAQ